MRSVCAKIISIKMKDENLLNILFNIDTVYFFKKIFLKINLNALWSI